MCVDECVYVVCVDECVYVVCMCVSMSVCILLEQTLKGLLKRHIFISLMKDLVTLVPRITALNSSPKTKHRENEDIICQKTTFFFFLCVPMMVKH